MTAEIDCLSLRQSDAQLMIAAQMHLTSRNADFQMQPYVFGRTKAGVNVMNPKKMWEKIVLAARAIAAVENPADVFVIGNSQNAQRAVLKFAKYTGATASAGRFTPGNYTNQVQAAFKEPRLLVVSCPRADRQPITEARYVNLPVIAFSNSDASLKHVDISIPCNNRSVHSIGLAWWLLTRQVLRIRGTISYETEWDVMPDLFFYRTPEEQEKEEEKEAAVPDQQAAQQQAPPPATEDWGEPVVAPAAAPAAAGGAAAAGASAGGFGAVGQPSAPTTDWGAAVDDSWGASATGGDWGASAAPETWG